ncbi:MAG TPA: hypothetical protein VHH92_03630 [Actinomycetota bacterium]|nr:hypothetical protein [Actinomycetota bacterium]
MSRKRDRRSPAGKADAPTKLTGTASRPAAGDRPVPGFGVALGRSVLAVGSSPLLLAAASGSLLATWAVFGAFGYPGTPRVLAIAMAISPAHLFLTDVQVALGAGSQVAVLGAFAALTVLRAVTFSLLTLLLGAALGTGTDLRAVGRRVPAAAGGFAALYIGEIGLVLVASSVLAGLLGQLAILVVPAAIYFLSLVPVVSVLEGASIRDAVTRGFRAVRRPGTGHLPFAAGYFLFIYLAASVSPFGPIAPATPTAPTWAFGLAVTFLHVAAMGALVLRWLAIRDDVPLSAAKDRPS